MNIRWLVAGMIGCAISVSAQAQPGSLREAVARDYRDSLGALFDHFHRNPELSGREERTAAR
ncbi:MAG TPA: hypothetical protein VF577_06200, partial [Allosphingosinicella sp.]